MISGELRDRVLTWIDDDPDQRDRTELRALLGDDAAAAELVDRFAARLTFGTAGLRGAVGAGPNRMNRAVVRAATAALAGWLRDRPSPDAPAAVPARDSVVIGCDARHRSEEFADEAACVLAGAGITVHMLPPRQPTPLLAFAIRHLGAAAGIMVTASHNPAADNGYKLYLADGAQIVPPADAEIEAAIRALGSLARVPVTSPASPLIIRHGDEIASAYLDAVTAPFRAPPGADSLRVVYTPLHGVAGGLALRAFEQAGFPAPDLVTAQAAPDPGFPTVAFPNPEEPGALDLALARARARSADLVIANDPDGDRLAVAVPDPEVAGGWRALTGDQLGALLGAYVLERTSAWPDPAQRLVATTVVSGTLLASIAASAGASYAETLTGFKWIVRAGDQRPGLRFIFGYEEALGFVIGQTVRDKDGIGAALAVLSLAARARSGGESLLDAYDALEVAHGVHLTAQLTLMTSAPALVMARLRDEPPDAFGELAVIAVTDLSSGTGGLPPADVLSYRLTAARVVIRPSGTEPKIKAYLQVVEPVDGGRLDVARRAAGARMQPLGQATAAVLAG
jgi:phosphomannomutase